MTHTRTQLHPAGDAAGRSADYDARLEGDEYNFEHFRAAHLLADARRTFAVAGVRPGEPAPDFELTRAGGGTVRLSDFRGRPVLVHFGSFS